MIKHRGSERFAYIETCLYWGRGVTAPQLAEIFGIDRRSAQVIIAQYREKYPHQITYNESTKRHEPTTSFEAYFINTDPHLYLDYLRGSQLVEHFTDHVTWGDLTVVDVDRYFRTAIDGQTVKAIIKSIHHKQALSIEYHAKSQWHYITISPHRLVYASRRYHVRAYVHEWNQYVDIVLSRIYTLCSTQEAWVSGDNDEEWSRYIELHFKPNPSLPEHIKHTLLIDYYNFSTEKSLLEKEILVIKVNDALKAYVLREMERIDWKHNKRLWLLIK